MPDDYTAHLVLLGGVDWNIVSGLRRTGFAQRLRWSRVDARQFKAVLATSGSRPVLLEDVAHFFRAPNPFNIKRTLTMCNGMYGRGTLGAVRALTDARFRDRNEEYLRKRFGASDTASILARVRIVNGKVVTPDWTRADTRLHEWPRENS
jgi:hypothetical protein